jgi:hypothetical protein
MNLLCLRQRVLAAGLLLTLIAHTAALKAQSAPTPALAAGDHEKRAQVAYAIQDWPTAIHEFEAAFQIEQKPDYLWGLAQAQRLSGNFGAALNSYKAYRRSDVSLDQAAAADNQVTQCQTELAKKRAEAAPSQPLADADSAAKSKHVAPKTLPDAGQAPGQEKRPFYLDPVGDVLVLTGLAAAGVGTYFLIKGNADVRPSPALPLFSHDASVDRGAKEQTAGVATLAGAGLLVASGLVRYLTLGSTTTGAHSELAIGPLGFDWRGRF